MAELKQTINKKKEFNAGAANGMTPLKDIFFMTLRFWPWIIASVVICVGFAYIYLLCTPYVYTRSAELLIKEDTKGKKSGGEEFADMGLFKTKTNIENEMTNLKAKDLMEEVVKRLGLDIDYYKSGRFHDEVVYGYNLPVKVTLENFPAEGSLSFDLNVSEGGKVSIENLSSPDGPSADDTYTGNLNSPIRTPLGTILVTASNSYKKGETVELKVKKSPLSVSRDSYNGRLAVAMSTEKGTVLKLTMSDQSVQRADEVLNTLINVYNENWIRDKNQIAVSTSTFINDRLGVIEGELGNVDSDISSYKSATLTPDVEAAASMYMSQSQQTQEQILNVNNQLSIARYIRSYLASADNKDQLLPANSGLNSTNVLTLINEYNDKVLQRNSLVAKSSEENPLVRQIDEQLNRQRLAIIRTVDNEIIALSTQLSALRGNEAQTVSKLASNPAQAKNLLSVERQQKVKESLYLFLLQKREENELSQTFTAYNTRIVNKPGASGVPPTPNRRNILAVAFLLGLAIPFGYFYVKETFNTKVRGRKDIENLTVPFLGEIPLYAQHGKGEKGEDNDRREVVVKAGKRDVINEAFRVLRTNFEFMKTHKDSADVVAVTSFNPGSGKSFLSINLAVTLALKNQRVLVIDGDMRRGSLSKYIGAPKVGISDLLSGNVSEVKEITVDYPGMPCLHILPVGTMPPNPTELLENGRFQKMIAELRDKYDYIIIDCPPIEIVADAQIIDRQADRTVFVARAGLLERSMLPQLDKLYIEKKYNNMAVVLNGTGNSHGRYGYSHSYSYGYGYGYEYGYDYEGKDSKK